MYTLFAAIVPVFIIILIGMAVERTSLIPESAGQVLGIFVVNVAMPCLLFHAMSQVTVEQLAQGGWWLVQVAAQLIFFAVFFAIDRLCGCSFGACVISGISVGFPNAAFVGLPVVMSLMPGNSEALTVAGLCLVATNINGVLAPVALGAWNRKRRGEKTEGSAAKRFLAGLKFFVLGNPVACATLLGVLVALLHIHIWEPLDKAIKMVGMLAPACMLFSLGFGLRAKFVRALSGGMGVLLHSLMISTVKLVLFPAFTWAGLAFMGYTGVWLAVPVIIASTGCAVVCSVFGEVYGASPEESAMTVAITNIVSFFSLLTAIWLLQQQGVTF